VAMKDTVAVGVARKKEGLRNVELVEVQEKSAMRGRTVRLNLVLPDKSASRLEKLKELTEASSYTEVIRNAIRLYEAIVMEYEKGNKVQIVDKDGKPLGTSIF